MANYSLAWTIQGLGLVLKRVDQIVFLGRGEAYIRMVLRDCLRCLLLYDEEVIALD